MTIILKYWSHLVHLQIRWQSRSEYI